MRINNILDAIGTILLFIGLFLAFLPHAVHTSVGLNNGVSHLWYVIAGVALAVFALAILVCNKKALKAAKRFI